MDHPLIVVAAICALALTYVLTPLVLNTFAQYRKARPIICPEDGVPAQIKIDARQAALAAAAGKSKLRIQHCSLWPQRRGCAQQCLRQTISLP